MLSDFYHNNDGDKIWWVDEYDIVDGEPSLRMGEFLFSFDKKTVFNVFTDYPWKLTSEQKALFALENPYLAELFGGRK